MKKIVILLFVLYIGIKNGIAQNEGHFNTPAILELVNKADTCYQKGERTCDQLYKDAATLAQSSKVDDWSLIIHKLSMYYFRTNQMDSVWKYLDLGLSKSKDENAIEAFLSLKSQILFHEGHSDSSIQVMITLANRLEKRNRTDKLAYTLGNIGIALYAQEDFEKSISYLNKSFTILEAINDTVLITTLAGNISDGYYALHQDSLAKIWSYKTLQLKKATKANEGFLLAYQTLSKIYKTLNVDSALFYSDKAIVTAEAIKNKELLGNAYAQYAAVLHHANRSKDAQLFIEKAIQYYREAPFIPGLATELALAGDISIQNGQHVKAARYYQEYIKLNDSLKSEQNFKTISELTTKYETEKKERQLAEQALLIQEKDAQMRNWLIGGGVLLLSLVVFVWQYRRSQQRKLKLIEQENENAVLKAMMNGEERERNRISKDLHDGVAAMLGAAKMSLQSIPFLSEEKKMEQLEKTAQLVSNTHAEVRRIAHDLLPVTLEKEGLIAAVAQFAADINATNILDFQVNNQLPAGFVFPKSMELMLYRIIQELVNNVIRHSHATQVQVTFIQTNEQLQIEVKDNGIGLTEAKESQGLYSIRERLKALGGSFNIKAEERKGTRVQLLLELK